jgi:hypothetical protein
MKWIPRERSKIDRIVCPWLIKNFVDRDAEFIYVPKLNAIHYDLPGAEYTHEGEFCTFDYIVKKHKIIDPAVRQIAEIVRGADTIVLNLLRKQRDSGRFQRDSPITTKMITRCWPSE